ncbi:hypothetical protein BHM03_00036440 [Ensete ventricosum]|nr:hypothetical protein BHM03_00036440 [Ensete ventricosum]
MNAQHVSLSYRLVILTKSSVGDIDSVIHSHAHWCAVGWTEMHLCDSSLLTIMSRRLFSVCGNATPMRSRVLCIGWLWFCSGVAFCVVLAEREEGDSGSHLHHKVRGTVPRRSLGEDEGVCIVRLG